MGEWDFNSSCPSKRNQSMLLSYKALEWVPVSSTGKIFCRWARDLSLNPEYTKNQLVSWPDSKNYHAADTIGSNAIIIKNKNK